ncbi:bactofilin family protein ['Paenibacillus yunnanensis' Narsing Rao et al. 2020]|uniref:bactofilin family protein n=1 Tax=Paenibacillus tengchongensis TaxID=2608684 RepID=UPI00124E28FD|nr:polymer-forming cytoskeletal protein [Paenibacillus tengchongensis]
MLKKNVPVKATDSLIGQGGALEGKILCDTNLRIEGSFSGEIDCRGTVTVGEQGTVHSSIKATEVIIAGKVFGDVTADRRLTMTESGQLHGNIVAAALSISAGSVLNGSVAMAKQPAPEPAGGLLDSGKTDKKGKSSHAQGTLEAG